ncbi:hypothetical protein DACRYDRAFT_109256, partial [Dacryopinax primogenitus]
MSVSAMKLSRTTLPRFVVPAIQARHLATPTTPTNPSFAERLASGPSLGDFIHSDPEADQARGIERIIL